MKIFLTFIFSCILSISLIAQQTVSTAGGNATGGGGTVNYTVGQVAITKITGSNGSVAQGVQQPYEISVVTALEEARDINLNWLAYPNPVSDNLKLDFKNSDNPGLLVDNLSYQLYDINGKLLLNNKLDGSETTISMQNFSSGTYILKVVEKQGNKSPRELKTFKIIKN